MAGSACFHSTLPWSFLPFRVWTGLVLTRIESKKATAQPQSPAPLQPACQGRQAQAGPFWLPGHRAALLESSPSGFNCFYILIIILFAKVWNEDMKKSNIFRTPQPFKTLPWSLQFMGEFFTFCLHLGKTPGHKAGKGSPLWFYHNLSPSGLGRHLFPSELSKNCPQSFPLLQSLYPNTRTFLS